MKKLKVRLRHMGYNEFLYRNLFNIEENCLPLEYHKFNNFFLFHCMRCISFMDAYNERDSLFASIILVRLHNLIYHKFPDQELEDEFKKFIMDFEDYYLHSEKWSNEFEYKNVTQPNHPERIKRDAEADQKRRIMIIAQLENMGYTPDSSLSTADLYNQLEEAIAKEQAREAEELTNANGYLSSQITGIKPSEIEEVSEANPSVDEEDDEGPVVLDDEEVTPPKSLDDMATELENDTSEKLVKEIEEKMATPEFHASVEKFINNEGESSEMKEFDDFASKIGDELVAERNVINNKEVTAKVKNNDILDVSLDSIVAEDTNGSNLGHITLDDAMIVNRSELNKPTPKTKKVVAFVDRFNYYYIKNDGKDTYTYYTREGTVHEEDVPEVTVLQLMGCGNLQKTTKEIPV